ncbi:hypothetical protein CNMCM5878_003969 [Aspergillus fumigatiaffinis]|nr:hypothetical protein CNMCM5878_003969 [Aspergillus fumigatiaffinis]
MDFVFNTDGRDGRVWVPANLIMELESRLATCLYYMRTPSTHDDISDPFPPHFEWGRLILFEGLTTVNDSTNLQQACFPPFVTTDNATGRTRTPLSDIFNLHCSCVDPSPNWDYNVQFQMTFYEVLRELPIHDAWEHGILYPRSNNGPNTVFRKACVTFFLFEGVQWANGPKRKASWSIIICAPSGFFGQIQFSDTFRPSGGPIQLDLTADGGYVTTDEAILSMLSKCVPIIVDKWRATWKELSDLIESDGYATFMKPEEYVHLLYDEASFPRSRFYFWAIGCLSAFEDDVTTNIRQLKAFRKVQLDDAASFGKSFDRRMDPITKKLDPATKDLEDIAEQLQKKLAALQALRDGCLLPAFRSHRRKHSRHIQNAIKLILSQAFWSVPDINATWPGIRTPICASAIGGIITYLVVFNLDTLESLGRSVLSGPRNYLIRKMSSTQSLSPGMKEKTASQPPDRSKLKGNFERNIPLSSAQQWQSRAKDFEIFPRPDKNPKPSDWWLLLFAVRLSFTSVCDILSRLWRNFPSIFHEPARPQPTLPQHRNCDVESGPRITPEAATVQEETKENTISGASKLD